VDSDAELVKDQEEKRTKIRLIRLMRRKKAMPWIVDQDYGCNYLLASK
jgi:hypothetical protein